MKWNKTEFAESNNKKRKTNKEKNRFKLDGRS